MRKTPNLWLLAGVDGLIILAIAIIGYLTHYSQKSFSFQWMTTFLPSLLGWAMAAIPMGLYTQRVNGTWWLAAVYAFLAGTLAGTFAVIVRGLWLGSMAVPIFAVVLGGTMALSLMAWRAVISLVISSVHDKR